MEFGLNVAINSRKGARSFIRLNTLRDKTVFYAKQFKELFGHDIITEITEEQLHKFFNDMKTGALKKKDGGDYRSTSYFISCFKAFWHWHVQIHKKQNKIEIPDITVYLDTKAEKPKWVYLVEEDVRKLCNNAKYDYKILI